MNKINVLVLGRTSKGTFNRIHKQWSPNNMNDGFIHKRSGRFYVYYPKHRLADKKGYVLRSILHYEYFNNKLIEKGNDIHHIDKDRLNDDPDNLLQIEHAEHGRLHNPRQRIERVCLFCKKKFGVQLNRIKNKKGKYCSMGCRRKDGK